MPLLNFVIMYDKIIKLSFKEEYLMEINDILEKFNFKGELEECNVFGSGHINTTYLAKYIENGKEKKYVVQKVNTNIFPDIDSLMNNIFSVTEFLRKKSQKTEVIPTGKRSILSEHMTKTSILKMKTVIVTVHIALLIIQRLMILLTAQRFLAKAVKHSADFKSI